MPENTYKQEVVDRCECPDCGAEPGDPCRSLVRLDQRPQTDLHLGRYTVANLLNVR